MTHIRIYKELRKAIAGCLAVMLLPLLAACEHKDLCYDHPHSANVEVVFDWTEAPDAHPATMSLYLYPEDGSEPMRYEFTKREGGTIIVPEGMYDALCVNSDKETHRIQNKERMETFQVTTGDTRSLRGALATGRGRGAQRDGTRGPLERPCRAVGHRSCERREADRPDPEATGEHLYGGGQKRGEPASRECT